MGNQIYLNQAPRRLRLTVFAALTLSLGLFSGCLFGSSSSSPAPAANNVVQPVLAGQAPVAYAETISVNLNSSQPFTLSGASPAGAALTYTIEQAPLQGTLSGIPPLLTYAPGIGFTGTDQFTFTVTDGQNTSPPATVSLNVGTIAGAPTANGQTVLVTENSSLPIQVTGSDPNGLSLQFSIVTQPLNGTIAGIDGAYIYTPFAGFLGADSFTFTASNGTTVSSTSTVSINVVTAVLAPIANSQSVNLVENSVAPIALTGADQNGLPLTFVVVMNPSHGTLSGTLPNLVYSPSANYVGADSFTFKTNNGTYDSTPATISLNVTATELTPTAVSQSLSTPENTSLSIVLSATGSAGATFTYKVVTQPQHGTLTGTAPNVVYSPTASYVGSDSFTFTATDSAMGGNLVSAAATLSLNVTATQTHTNTPPTANAQSISTKENTAASITLTGSDPNGLTLSYAIATQPSHGTLSGTAPNVNYAPNNGYVGADSFTFKTSDSSNSSSSATVSITVTQVVTITAPSANSQSISTKENTATSLTLTGSDSNNLALTYSIATQPSHGTLSGTPPSVVYSPSSNYIGSDSFTFTTNNGTLSSTAATVSITVTQQDQTPTGNAQSVSTLENTNVGIVLTSSSSAGAVISYAIATQPSHGTLSGTPPNVTYAPAANYSGSDSFTFTVKDTAAGENLVSAAATVSITVRLVTHTPTASSASYATSLNSPLYRTASATDSGGTISKYTVVANPAHGTLSFDTTAGGFTYIPNTAYLGADQFTFNASDTSGTTSNTATVNILISTSISCGVVSLPSPSTSCSGNIIASGSLFGSSSPSLASQDCASSGLTGGCCMFETTSPGMWYMTDGLVQTGSRACTSSVSCGLSSACSVTTPTQPTGAFTCQVGPLSNPVTSCTGTIVDSGSMGGSSNPSDAAKGCEASKEKGSCCMFHNSAGGMWYLTNGRPESGSRICQITSAGTYSCAGAGSCQ